MNEQLKLLIELQAVDDRVSDLRGKLAEIPRRIESLQSGCQREQKTIEDLRASLESAGKERRTAERELEGYEEKIRKLKDQQFMVKTNKEYQTFNHEISVMEEKKSSLEDGILAMMEKVAETEGRILSQEAVLAREKEHFAAQEAKLKQERARLEAGLAEAEEQRTRLVAGVEGENLKRYRRLIEFHKGKAVAGVIDGICQGCFLGLRPQTYQEVKRGDQILACDQCKRIIFLLESPGEKQPPPAPEG